MQRAERQPITTAEQIHTSFRALLKETRQQSRETRTLFSEGVAALVETQRIGEQTLRVIEDYVAFCKDDCRSAQARLSAAEELREIVLDSFKTTEENSRILDSCSAGVRQTVTDMRRNEKKLARIAKGGFNWLCFFDGVLTTVVVKGVFVLSLMYYVERGY